MYLDRSTGRSFELDNIRAIWKWFFVDDDFHVFNLSIFAKSVDSIQSHPEVVCVEDLLRLIACSLGKISNLELGDRFELVDVLFWDLSDFQKSGFSFVVDQRTTLNSTIITWFNDMEITLTSARVLSVTSMQYSLSGLFDMCARMFMSTVAPRLSMLERKIWICLF